MEQAKTSFDISKVELTVNGFFEHIGQPDDYYVFCENKWWYVYKRQKPTTAVPEVLENLNAILDDWKKDKLLNKLEE